MASREQGEKSIGTRIFENNGLVMDDPPLTVYERSQQTKCQLIKIV